MAVAPTYTTARAVDKVAISTANTNRDGTGTIGTLATAVAAGTKFFEIVVQALGTTTAGMVRLYHSSDGGTTWTMFDEVDVSAITVGANVKAFRQSKTYANLVLVGTSAKLGVSTHNAESFEIYALGGDLT